MPQAIVVLALVAAVLRTAPALQHLTSNGLEVRLFVHASLDADEMARMRETAGSLLATTALAITWVNCDQEPGRCQQAAGAGTVVQVLLKPYAKPGRSAVCGETSRDLSSHHPTVVVYVSCGRAVTDQLRRRSRDPRLLTLRVGHVVALALAHELGHLWGLMHSPDGLMKARHDADDILAMRSSRLTLAANEAKRFAEAVKNGQGLYARH